MQQMLAVTQRSGDAKTENILGRITVIGYPRTFLQGKETFKMETYERLIVLKKCNSSNIASSNDIVSRQDREM
jgi:ribosomal protein S10